MKYVYILPIFYRTSCFVYICNFLRHKTAHFQYYAFKNTLKNVWVSIISYAIYCRKRSKRLDYLHNMGTQYKGIKLSTTNILPRVKITLRMACIQHVIWCLFSALAIHISQSPVSQPCYKDCRRLAAFKWKRGNALFVSILHKPHITPRPWSMVIDLTSFFNIFV